ncbi:inward rectifier K+ channel family transporter [Dorcoceras hygrometricum]|uniref:Inward rectifier K+ channel family transporter n=1 Tax=Dorcoceras hygrometricum TaxID=472368 RepID=A0A2Z7AQ71_9LAMI|nr:inward rectifier K+ channel family transporter [Dorcoceras hygrometricum]
MPPPARSPSAFGMISRFDRPNLVSSTPVDRARWPGRARDGRNQRATHGHSFCMHQPSHVGHGSSRGSAQCVDRTWVWSCQWGSDQGWPERCRQKAGCRWKHRGVGNPEKGRMNRIIAYVGFYD